ncbi:hypothetical protein ACFSJS_00110 [Streptomyces desertarenae]|uniref:Secreted protein n=1 Tax=Streptomyces desertarenae TaxID=2666184 RepID=A0ABW4PC89_9ACTN
MAHPSASPFPGASPAGPPAPAGSAARLRRAAATEPGRLRILGAALTALVLAFGAQAAWQTAQRAAAADTVIGSSQPLTAGTASLHRHLADADTTAAGAFLAGGAEPPELRERYERDVRTVARLLAEAAAENGGPGPDPERARAHEEIAGLTERFPVYTGLVEAARANNRQGLPLGGAYLRHAGERMREDLLPAAAALHRSEAARLRADHAAARSRPTGALLTGAAALAALCWAQRRDRRRTNRVVNLGLAAATAATAAGVLWLAAGHGLARSALEESDRRGSRSLQALNEAWAGALRARGDENLMLVARGGGAAYEEDYLRGMRELTGAAEPGRRPGGLLGRALELADDRAGREPVEEAVRAAAAWRERHAAARALETGGRYEEAVAVVVGPGRGTARSAFDAVDGALAEAVRHEQREFERAAQRGRAALGGLAAGSLALSVLGAAGVVLGVGRRLSEYR